MLNWADMNAHVNFTQNEDALFLASTKEVVKESSEGPFSLVSACWSFYEK